MLADEIREKEEQFRVRKQSLDNEHLKVLAAAEKHDVSLVHEDNADYVRPTAEE